MHYTSEPGDLPSPDEASLLAGLTPDVRQEVAHELHAEPHHAPPDERIEFISHAAHELRGPLTSIKGYAQLLLRGAHANPDIAPPTLRALQAIEQQSSRMSDMVAELLDAVRIQRGTFELHARPADLEELARHAVEQRRPTLERHDLLLEVAGSDLRGSWDAPRVEQVVRDLLDNALRFSPEGGAVVVHLARAGTMARACVQDEGIGVAADERAHIFDPFYHGTHLPSRNLAGLGLGLFVSRAIVEGLGGRLWQEDDPTQGRGSRFCFELPCAANA